MKRLLIFLVISHAFARNGTQKRSLRQTADDAFRYGRDDDIQWSAETLKDDDLLKNIFPGIFFHFLHYSH